MRFPRLTGDKSSVFKDIEVHAEKIKECAWSFQQTMECYCSKTCESLEDHRQDILRLTNEAHVIKTGIKNQIAKGKKLPFDGFALMMLLNAQSSIVTAIENAMEWLAFRSGQADQVIPQIVEKDFFLLFDAVIDPVEELVKLISESRKYFSKKKKKQRETVLNIIAGISKMEMDANKFEDRLKKKIFSLVEDQMTVFHLIRLSEIVASISNQVEIAGDITRVVI
jgi:predicted phosphate transport protein (TIGR00153 family)